MAEVKIYKEIEKKLVEGGMEFNVESLKFLVKHKKSKAEISIISPNEDIENTVYLVACGSKGHTLDEAYDIIFGIQQEFKMPSELVHMAAMNIGRANGFFMNEQALNAVEVMSKEEELVNCQEIMDVMLSVMQTYNQSSGIPKQKPLENSKEPTMI